VAAVNLAYYVAIDHLPVGVAGALQYTGPAILLAVTTLLVRREAASQPGRLAWAAAGLTLAGAVLVSQALEGLGGLDLPGLAAGLASAVLFAAYLLAAELAGPRGGAAADHGPGGGGEALPLPGRGAGLPSAVLSAAYLLAAELAARRGAEPATTLLWGFLVAVAIWAGAAPWGSWPPATPAGPG